MPSQGVFRVPSTVKNTIVYGRRHKGFFDAGKTRFSGIPEMLCISKDFHRDSFLFILRNGKPVSGMTETLWFLIMLFSWKALGCRKV